MYQWIITALCLLLGIGNLYAVEIRDIDFEQPNLSGNPPLLGDAPNQVSSIVFGQPLVESGITGMTGQSLVFRASPASPGYQQIQVDAIDQSVETYTIAFDFNPIQLIGTGFYFAIWLDTPTVHTIDFLPDGYYRFYKFGNVPALQFADGALQHIDITFHTPTKTATIKINDVLYENLDIGTGFLKSVRFGLTPYNNGPVSDAVAALDNIKISAQRRAGSRVANKGLRTDIEFSNVAVGADIQNVIDNQYSTLDAVGQINPSIDPPFGDASYNLLSFRQFTAAWDYTNAYVMLDPQVYYHDIRFSAVSDLYIGGNTRFLLAANGGMDVVGFYPSGVIKFYNKAVASFVDGTKTNFRVTIDELASQVSLYINDELVDSQTRTVPSTRYLALFTRPEIPYSATATPNARLGIENLRIVDKGFTETALTLSLKAGVNKGKCKNNVAQFIATVENQTAQDASNGIVTLALPDGFSLVQSSDIATCSQDQTLVSCALGTLSGNSLTDVALDVSGAACKKKFEVTASVDSDSYEKDTSDNQAQGVFGGAASYFTLLALAALAALRRTTKQ